MKFKSPNAKAELPKLDPSAELIDATLACNIALENLYAAEAANAEVDVVIANIESAVNSINRFGLKAANMSIFDEGGDLSRAIGLEALELSALESMAVADIEELKNTYTAGLEALAKDAFNAAIDGVVKLWKALVAWFKALLDKNEKYRQYIEANKGALDGADISGATGTILSYSDAIATADGYTNVANLLKAVAVTLPKSIGMIEKGETSDFGIAFDSAVKTAIAKLKDFGITEGKDGIVIGEFPFKEVEGKTLKELGYDAAKAKTLCDKAETALKDQSLKSLAHAIDKAYAAAVKEYKAAGDDEKKQEMAKAKKTVAAQADRIVKFGAAMLRKVAFAGYTCCKAAKAPAKAEGDEAKKDEQK